MAQRPETREELKRRLEQRKPPGWAAKHDKPGSALNIIFVLGLAIVIAGATMWLVVRNVANQEPMTMPVAASDQPGQAQPGAPTAQTAPAAAQAARLVPIPAAERHFAGIIAAAAVSYDPAAAGAVKAAAQEQRAEALCHAFPSPLVTRWAGIVKTLSSTGPDRTILAITLDVQAAPAAGAEATPAPAVPPITILASPPLLPAPERMNPGDTVTFSGSFVPDSTGQACFQEGNYSTDEAMQTPAFLMQLSNVNEAQ